MGELVVHLFLKKEIIYIYLAPLGLNCGTRDLRSVMQDLSRRCTDSVVVTCGISCPTACEILVPQPGIKPTSPALQGDS